MKPNEYHTRPLTSLKASAFLINCLKLEKRFSPLLFSGLCPWSIEMMTCVSTASQMEIYWSKDEALDTLPLKELFGMQGERLGLINMVMMIGGEYNLTRSGKCSEDFFFIWKWGVAQLTHIFCGYIFLAAQGRFFRKSISGSQKNNNYNLSFHYLFWFYIP